MSWSLIWQVVNCEGIKWVVVNREWSGLSAFCNDNLTTKFYFLIFVSLGSGELPAVQQNAFWGGIAKYLLFTWVIEAIIHYLI